MGVDEAQKKISYPEFIEWVGFKELYPFADEKADWRNGVSTSILANLQCGESRFKPEDFYYKPQVLENEKEQTTEEIENILKSLT